MSAGSIIFTAGLGVIFFGLVVLAILGFLSTGRAAQETVQTGREKSGRAVGAPRRASRPRKRDRVTLLPADATVTLAAERQEANVDELFDALNRELVGLVPVKQKIEE